TMELRLKYRLRSEASAMRRTMRGAARLFARGLTKDDINTVGVLYSGVEQRQLPADLPVTLLFLPARDDQRRRCGTIERDDVLAERFGHGGEIRFFQPLQELGVGFIGESVLAVHGRLPSIEV